MELTRYPSYKPSGIEWIGEIPSHWDTIRADALFDVLNEKIPQRALSGKTWMHYSIPAVQETGTGILEDGETLDSDKLRVHGGELLVSKLNPRKETVTMVLRDSHDKICSGEFIVLMAAKIDPRFGYYLYRSHATKERICSTAQSATKSHQRANPEDIYKIWHAVPPPSEQTAIAAYLDEKTAQIDKLIAAKRRMIELLKEERQAIINEAVSGEGKKGWVRKKLKYLLQKVGSGITPRGGSETYLNAGIPFLRSQNILNNGLDLTDVVFISDAIDEEMSNSRIADGDVLLNITGASIGRSCVIPDNFGRGNVNQHVCILRPIESKVKSKYLHAFLISDFGQVQIDTFQNGANREGLNYQQIKGIEIDVPSTFIQEEILSLIEQEEQKLNKAVDTLELEVSLLREYRLSLIAEVVTGKVNVYEGNN